MAELREFKAFLYHPQLHDQMSDLVSPPYDVLSEEDRKKLLEKNPYNSVRLCLKAPNESYQDLRKIFENWQKEGVLKKVDTDSLYLIEESYECEGKSYLRIGFVGLVKLVDFDKKEVFPHEYTLKGPKADRLEMLKHLGADFSQIFFCYDDPDKLLEKIYAKNKSKPVEVDATDPSGIRRRLWILSEKNDIQNLKTLIKNKELLIADGHHRYETALHYSQTSTSRKSAYAQAYFTNRASEGLQILPIHRLTQLPAGWTKESFLHRLAQDFHIENMDGMKDPAEFLRKHHNDKFIHFFLFFANERRGFYLRREKKNYTDAEIFSLQNQIFEAAFSWNTAEISKGQLNFAHSTEGFFSQLNKIENGIGFFLPPTSFDLVMDVVRKGQRMPQKSTFFFPKIASGLVIYELGSYSDSN